MDAHFIIMKPFCHEVGCCCPEQQHQHMINFHQGDVWTITDNRKYVDCLGWHYLIDINNEFQFFMHVEDIEELQSKGSICSIWDLDLKINYLNFKIDEALEAHDRESFLSLSNELHRAQQVKSKMHYSYVQII
ncbi:IDEAL domain-containing protein [Priestia aryabhattai]|uniref:IDEAL domain-containing protein n=1 Tax=Priestia megaterium TaxID=1404 RepID=UPI0039B845B4